MDRSEPALPGIPERRSHDYLRNGITTLFAAFDIGDGTVIDEVHRRHRAVEFKTFLTAIDETVPEAWTSRSSATTTAPTRPRRSKPGWPDLNIPARSLLAGPHTTW